MSRLLLDTHVALWAVIEPTALAPAVLDLLQADEQELFLSLASVWELAIKSSRGKIRLPQRVGVFAEAIADQLGAAWLPIRLGHLARVETLPFHHADPFDRLLVAQAVEEDLVLVTADASLGAYDANLILACR